jgi:hypothetical protein
VGQLRPLQPTRSGCISLVSAPLAHAWSVPTEESISASFRILTMAFFSATELGFILKLPPTKNLRAIVEDWSGSGRGSERERSRLDVCK